MGLLIDLTLTHGRTVERVGTKYVQCSKWERTLFGRVVGDRGPTALAVEVEPYTVGAKGRDMSSSVFVKRLEPRLVGTLFHVFSVVSPKHRSLYGLGTWNNYVG